MFISEASAIVSVIVISKALLLFAFVSVFRVVISPSLIVALITPLVFVSMLFSWVTLVVPELTFTLSVPDVFMPDELRAVSMFEAVPLMDVRDVASTATLVFESSEFISDALRVVSVIVKLYALAPVSASKFDAVSLTIVAVITPLVALSTVFASATLTLVSLKVTSQLLSKPIELIFVIIVFTSATRLASIVVIALASIFTLVFVSKVFNSLAFAPLSVIVILKALLLFAFVSVFRVVISPSLIVALITPLVFVSMLFSWVTLVVPELTFTLSVPDVFMPDELRAVSMFEAVPLMDVRDVASITPVVSKSKLFKSNAIVVVSDILTLSSKSKPVIVPALFASKLAWTSAIVPLRFVTALSIVTTPLVFEFNVFISTAATLRVSVVVTLSLPKPEISPAPFALYVEVTSAIVPVKLLTLEASITPLVEPFSVFNSLALTFVSLIVISSSPSITTLLALYTAWTSEIVPLKVVTPESILTLPLVFAANVVISVATTLRVSVVVRFSLPSPLISPFVFAS